MIIVKDRPWLLNTWIFTTSIVKRRNANVMLSTKSNFFFHFYRCLVVIWYSWQPEALVHQKVVANWIKHQGKNASCSKTKNNNLWYRKWSKILSSNPLSESMCPSECDWSRAESQEMFIQFLNLVFTVNYPAVIHVFCLYLCLCVCFKCIFKHWNHLCSFLLTCTSASCFHVWSK